jgi:CDP-glucose 4,6-dehydratase
MSLPSAAFWSNKRVLLTGHTGFKGAWLSSWLLELGARPTGYALDPDTTPSLYGQLGLGERMRDERGDLAEADRLAALVREVEPEIVLHLAAQPLVRRSYREPIATFATNVMGTAHLLEACRQAPSVRAVVVVTTDKVYENREQIWAYREPDALGGHDPYSASKACAEIVTSSYRDAFLRSSGVGVATARAGNVIGGGDHSEDRLLPDLVRGALAGGATTIRNPSSVRPWQHVLEPLSGYLLLAERLYERPTEHAEGWNFGPPTDERVPVGALAERFVRALGRGSLTLGAIDPSAPHEAAELRLDSAKARARLGWRPRLGLEQAIDWTAAFYRETAADPHCAARSMSAQIEAYAALP